MADVSVSPQHTAGVGGIALTYRDDASATGPLTTTDRFLFTNTGREIVIVKNGSGASINVTVVTPGTVDGNAIADRVIAVADGADAAIGPLRRDVYSDSSGMAALTFSAVSDVDLAIVRY